MTDHGYQQTLPMLARSTAIHSIRNNIRPGEIAADVSLLVKHQKVGVPDTVKICSLHRRRQRLIYHCLYFCQTRCVFSNFSTFQQCCGYCLYGNIHLVSLMCTRFSIKWPPLPVTHSVMLLHCSPISCPAHHTWLNPPPLPPGTNKYVIMKKCVYAVSCTCFRKDFVIFKYNSSDTTVLLLLSFVSVEELYLFLQYTQYTHSQWHLDF